MSPCDHLHRVTCLKCTKLILNILNRKFILPIPMLVDFTQYLSTACTLPVPVPTYLYIGLEIGSKIGRFLLRRYHSCGDW
jgi:hypothetical protein